MLDKILGWLRGLVGFGKKTAGINHRLFVRVWSFSKPLFQIRQKLGKEKDGYQAFAMANPNYRKFIFAKSMPKKEVKPPIAV